MSSITILTDAFADNPLNAPLYALPYMLSNVTLSGMVTDVKPLHPWKAYSPIDVTLSGMVTDVKPLQSEYLQLVVYQLIYNKTVEK